jgi:hypothetical protein
VDLPWVVVARKLLRSDEEIDSVAVVPRYPLRSNPGVVLVSPLHTPPRRRCINLVSETTTDASTAMSTDQRPSGVVDDPAKQSEDVTSALTQILGQLATINKRLEIQGELLARHDNILMSGDGSATPMGPHPTSTASANKTGETAGAGSGGGKGGLFGHNNPSPRDHNADLRNSFHRPKLAFPRYDGESDPLPWLNRCESFFRGTRTMSAEQVWMASLHMDGIAAEWYYALEREYGLLSWARFTEFVNLCFGPPIRSNPLGELKELHRTGTVEEYQRQFLTLLCRCEGLSPQHQMNLFTAGLGEPMSSDVEMQRPADLQAAMSLARAFERRAGAVAGVPS